MIRLAATAVAALPRPRSRRNQQAAQGANIDMPGNQIGGSVEKILERRHLAGLHQA